ncbi:MAG: nucleotidyltransferase domain-containing protein [Deltaproteobacteria bacterium]|nr:nucleotidyltransferase domain-containing protein [Deltaproteobacteria bacterium]
MVIDLRTDPFQLHLGLYPLWGKPTGCHAVHLTHSYRLGSRARGDANPDSDLDVLVILDGPVSKQSRRIVSDNAWEVGFEAGIVVVPIVVSRESWEKGPERVSLLAMAVREEGVSI